MTSLAKILAVPFTYATACFIWFAMSAFLILAYFALGGRFK